MKNITEILTGLAIQIPEDKKAEFDKTFAENYKTIADYDRQKDKLAHAESDLKTARESLEAFKDVDVKDLQGQISKLTKDLQDKDAAHVAELADRDFNALLDAAISAKHGRSAKAVKAMLDMDSLKASKTQQADIDTALEQLAKDSSYLFDDGTTPPPYAGGTGSQGAGSEQNVALRAGKWSSSAARDGLWHQAGMIAGVLVAAGLDFVIYLLLTHIPAIALPFEYKTLVTPLVVCWYILTELGSVVENAAALGAPIPPFLSKTLEVLTAKLDKPQE